MKNHMSAENLRRKVVRILAITLFISVAAVFITGCSFNIVEIFRGYTSGSDASEIDLNYSGSFTADGYWAGIKALDHVHLCEYKGISMSDDIYNISDEAVVAEVNELLYLFSDIVKVTDREAMYGDMVNIEYTGRVDGLEFAGGSTGGVGIDITIGSSVFLEGFDEQIIGRRPGQSFHIILKMPDDYSDEIAKGKDADFTVKLHYIVNIVTPELSDDFVAKKLQPLFGWRNISEMESGITRRLKSTAVTDYLQKYVVSNSVITSLPPEILEFQKKLMLDYYREHAEYYKITLDKYLETYMHISDTQELLIKTLNDNTEIASGYLVMQAVAEDAGIVCKDDDVAGYFLKNTGSRDYSEHAKTYGLPYLKFLVLNQMVIDHLEENAAKQ